MLEIESLTNEELLFSLEKLVKIFGSENAAGKVNELINGFSTPVTDEQLQRINTLKDVCGIDR